MMLAAAIRSALDRLRGWMGRSDAALAANAGSPAESQSRFEQMFEHVGEALLLCDPSGKVLASNPRARQLCGNRLQAPHALDFIRNLEGTVRPSSGSDVLAGEWMFTQASGGRTRVKIRETILQRGASFERLVHLLETKEHAIDQDRLYQLANYDSLTQLPNRGLFRDRLAQAMNRADRSGSPLALMFLDLDRFKVVNDSLGHEIGDRLLVHVAKQLTQCLRAVDSLSHRGADEGTTLSRLGGDEFTVIAENIASVEHAGFVARRLLDALSAPFIVGEEQIVMEASIGIATYPTDDCDLDSLIRHADMAMYHAKSLGRGTFSFFSKDLDDAVSNRLSLEGNLRRAIERKEFELYYQPKANLATGEVTGVEALLRWNCPSMGMVRPDQFISVLEDTGMIVPVGAWVIREACADMARWDRLGLPPIRMAVNMSARQFQHQYLASLIEDTLIENEIDPGRLEIELTETLLMADDDASRAMFANFTRIGVSLAIDDFGTGHSSLAYLKRFKIDTLKIDRSFVKALPDDPDDMAIASAVIAMGHSMHMRVVAEGVETRTQEDCLRELGCDEMQGYLLSRPLPVAEFVDWWTAREAARSPRRFKPDFIDSPISRLLTLDEAATQF